MLKALFFLALSSALAAGQTTSEFKEVSFPFLSDRNVSAMGAKALGLRSNEWKHAESAHFVYHFFQSFVAAPVSVEAEYFYGVVAKELGRDTAQWERKCHVFIFDRADDWRQFQTSGKLDPWTGGLCTGGELFLLREAERKWKGDTLGHEVTHLVVYRFLGIGVPLWLNEGFAEYAASRGYSSFWRARGYKANPKVQAVNPTHWIPVTQLTSMLEYPSEDAKVPTFYNESERLVRFLARTDRRGFLTFLEAMAQGNRFDTALSKGFPGKFASLDVLDKSAKEYATREHGSTLQDE